MDRIKEKMNNVPWCIFINLIWVFIGYEICRLAFLFENWGMFQQDMTWASFWEISEGGLLFDTSAIFYTNALYILLAFFPLHYKENSVMRAITKWAYIIPNAFCFILNLVDAVYFPYSMHRTTAMVFDEFKNEDNLGTIFGVEFVRHWYFVLLVIVMIYGLYKLYVNLPKLDKTKPLYKYYLRNGLSVIIITPFIIMGMRGATFWNATRPIAISNAHQFVDVPLETGIVLNTPFAILRTVTEKPQKTPTYFANQADVDKHYSPLHVPADSAVVRKKNVVILIVESYAKEFIGAYNKHLDNGQYKGYTTFADSLINHSLTFEETFCNTGFSIDAMPAVLASIPRMDRPFVLTPFSLNNTNSIASELKKWGYYTAFFHGANNGSLGLEAFARSAGFMDYFGRTEFNQDSRFDPEKDFDGTWGIWDEPFLQYFCLQMSEMKEPFMTSVFTLSSHHPFNIPDKYKDVFKDEGKHLIHKCIRYTDNAIRQFFATAKKQPWYKNTIFVITADHASSKTTHAEYKTELGHFMVPIIIFDPSGEMPTGFQKGIAQQIDIMPTILNYLGYDKPYIAFGKDLLNTKPEDTWAVNWDHIPQYIKGDYLLQFDGEKATAFYNYKKDPLLKDNLLGKTAEEAELTNDLKAFIQSYMVRMSNNDIIVKE